MNYYEHSREELLDFIPIGVKSHLDVGCGSGGFLELVKKKFQPDVSIGIEPSVSAAEKGKSKGLKIINSFFTNDCCKELGNFDLISFNDVLEHVLQPEELLHLARKSLNSRGYVLASMPNFLYFENLLEIYSTQDWLYKDAGILDRTHLRFYTKKSMVRLFESCGFDILKIEGINPLHNLAPQHRRKFNLLKFISRSFISEAKFLQYAIVAQPISE